MSNLDADALQRAYEFNTRNSIVWGWKRIWSPLCTALGIPVTYSGYQFANAVADYQGLHGLTPDGYLGRFTLDHLRRHDPAIQTAMISMGIPGVIPHEAAYNAENGAAVIRASWESQLRAGYQGILNNKDRYSAVALKAQIPWYMVGLVHLREASFNFRTYLHNGDPLQDKFGNHIPTVHVPKGKFFLTWEDAAVDALAAPKRTGLSAFPGSIAAEAGYLERYNGMGYRNRGVPSPYLWSGTTVYTAGKFTADGHYDPAAVDKQMGTMAVRKWMDLAGLITV